MIEEQFRSKFLSILENNNFSDEKKEKIIKKIPLFLEYYSFLEEENKRQNLTTVSDYEGVIERHFIDSLLAYKLDLIKEGSLSIDVGSGAGFPGVPLAICIEGCLFELLEPTVKRAAFLNELIERLGLKNCRVINSRSEIVGQDNRYRERYDNALSRAVAPMNVLCELCLPLVKVGGKMLAYKSLNAKEELSDIDNVINILGGDHPLILGEESRNIVLIEKKAVTPGIYPRRNGVPQKRPLK